MDRTTICKAQAIMCLERATHPGADRMFWLAEAQRWNVLAGEHVKAVVSFEASRARTSETWHHSGDEDRRN